MSQNNSFAKMSIGSQTCQTSQTTKEKIKYFEMGERCKEIEISSKLQKFLEILLINSNDRLIEKYEEIFENYF